MDLDIRDVDAIRIDHPNGIVAARIGFLCTLYFLAPGDPAVRARLGQAVDGLLAEFGAAMRWVQTSDGASPAAIESTLPAAIGRTIAATDPNETVSFLIHSGERQQDAGHHSIAAFAPFDAPFSQLGYLTFTAGIGALASRPPGSILAVITRLCDVLKPLHGYAGLGIIRHPNPYPARKADPLVIPLARRFPGLELDMPISHRRKLRDGIKGINWLTIIGDVLCAKLSGRSALAQAAIAEGLGTIEYEGGVIIQAGDAPEPGDLDRDVVPPAYRIANALLYPLRAVYDDVIIAEEVDGFDREAFTSAWLSRFEGGRP